MSKLYDAIVAEIGAERDRQVEVEGFGPAHDIQHSAGELLDAATAYLWHGTDKARPSRDDGTPEGWPWEPQWWKPKDRRRNLIRAGALCAAEKERVTREGGRMQTYMTRWGKQQRVGRIDLGQASLLQLQIIKEIMYLDGWRKAGDGAEGGR